MFFCLSLISKLAALAFVAIHSVTAVDLPAPMGRFNTTYTVAKLVDYSRNDPYAPDNQPRALMVSIFTPIRSSKCASSSTTAYMPPTTASFYDTSYAAFGIPAGTFSSFNLSLCSRPKSNYIARQHPILLFSPGLGKLPTVILVCCTQPSPKTWLAQATS